MINAREILRNLNLPPADETEVQRRGAEIVAILRAPSFDGRPVSHDIPTGATTPERERSARIACALQRRFQSQLWTVHLETVVNVLGEPTAHRLTIAIDAVATRPESSGIKQAPAAAPVQGFSLAALHGELATMFGGASKASPLPSAPVLSVIFGTYNRLSMLQRAVESVRASVGDIAYEIVVCDGGSTDGSRAWLAAQHDVVLIGERRLDGAVRAFNQAFSLTRGAFIANLNDDAVVEGMALAEGVKHLQQNPRAGQVAFAFQGDGEDWHINDIYPRDKYPTVTWGTTYANFGITRREVADLAAAITGGFWAPVYGTYAADCELSAWTWKLGYTVDKRPDLRVTDIRNEDSLRARNSPNSGIEAKRMYARWPAEAFKPDGPDPRVSDAELERFRRARTGTLLAAPTKEKDLLVQVVEMVGLPEPQEERRLRAIAKAIRPLDPVDGQFPRRVDVLKPERVLHVHLGTDADPQAGLVRALAGWAGFPDLNWPRGPIHAAFADGQMAWAGIRWLELNHNERQRQIIEVTRSLRPTMLFMQLQTPTDSEGLPPVDAETIRRVREVADPSCVIIDWNGDIATSSSPWNVDWMAQRGRLIDLNAHSSMSHVRAMRAAGLHNSIHLDIGVDPIQYRPPQGDEVKSTDGVRSFDFDVTMLASRYGSDDFAKSMRWHDADLRDEVVAKMRAAFGNRFGLFGNGWTDPQFWAHTDACVEAGGACICGATAPKPIPLAQSHTAYWRSRIGLNISLSNDLWGYSSDRMHRILGCGSLLLTKRFPGMSSLGLVHGKNCLIWDTPDEAVQMAMLYVSCCVVPNSEIDGKPPTAIAEAGAKLAKERLTWDAKMREMAMYMDAVRSAR